MSWTEERIELLTRLWGEGRSASQIAAELGGVTRNAVIGKVHRLKLDNRPKGGADEGAVEIAPVVQVVVPPSPPAPAPVMAAAIEVPAPRREPVAPPAPPTSPSPTVAPAAAPRILTPSMPASAPPPRAPMPQRQPMTHSIMGATALKMEPDTDAFEDAQPFAHSDGGGGEVVPMSRNLTLVQLSERTCKWPLGDPLSPDFRFCGNHSQDASPYCKHHARIAFQPVSERRRVR